MELGNLVRIRYTQYKELNGRYGIYITKDNEGWNVIEVSETTYNCVAHNLTHRWAKNTLALYDSEIELVDIVALCDKLDALF
jgi:hypothetical protein